MENVLKEVCTELSGMTTEDRGREQSIRSDNKADSEIEFYDEVQDCLANCI